MNHEQFLNKEVTIKIDRPIGSKHPKFNDLIYELNYGFLPNTKSQDGEEIDAYLIGVNTPVGEFTGKCIAILHRENDKDDKLIIANKETENFSDQEILDLVKFQEKYFKTVIIR